MNKYNTLELGNQNYKVQHKLFGCRSLFEYEYLK